MLPASILYSCMEAMYEIVRECHTWHDDLMPYGPVRRPPDDDQAFEDYLILRAGCTLQGIWSMHGYYGAVDAWLMESQEKILRKLESQEDWRLNWTLLYWIIFHQAQQPESELHYQLCIDCLMLLDIECVSGPCTA